MARETWTFELELNVVDKMALLRAAQAHPDGIMMGPLMKDGEVDVGACLATLLDNCLPGCDNIGHTTALMSD